MNNQELPKLNNSEENSQVIPPIVQQPVNNVEVNNKSVYQEMFEYLTTRKGKDLGLLILNLLLIIVVVIIFYFPFKLLEILLSNVMLAISPTGLTNNILLAINIIINIGYTIFGIVTFFKLIKKRYEVLVKNKLVR